MKIKVVDLQKVGQCHRLQFSQSYHSKKNVEISQCLPHILVLDLTVSDIYYFLFVLIRSVGQGHGVQFLAITFES